MLPASMGQCQGRNGGRDRRESAEVSIWAGCLSQQTGAGGWIGAGFIRGVAGRGSDEQ